MIRNLLILSMCFILCASCRDSVLVLPKYNGDIKGQVVAYVSFMPDTGVQGENLTIPCDSIRVYLINNNIIKDSTITKNGFYEFYNKPAGIYTVRAKICEEVKKEIQTELKGGAFDSVRTILFKNEIDTAYHIWSSPNPFSNAITLKYILTEDAAAYEELYNIKGQLLKTRLLGDSKGNLEMIISSYSPYPDGLYCFLFKFGNKINYIMSYKTKDAPDM